MLSDELPKVPSETQEVEPHSAPETNAVPSEGQAASNAAEGGEINEGIKEENIKLKPKEAAEGEDMEMTDAVANEAEAVAEAALSNPTDATKDAKLSSEVVGEHENSEGADNTMADGDMTTKIESAPIQEDDEVKGRELSTGDDSATPREPSYSTRGRSGDKETKPSGENLAAREALEEIGRVKEGSPAAMGVSFLESLGEEERRSRTRYVPDVDGMHALRKHEIRDDIALARSLVSSSGATLLKKSKGKRADAMDVDDESGVSPSDDGSTDIARPGTKTIELATRDLAIPSNAFLGSGEDGQGSSIPSLKTYNGVKSPLLVEAVTAFNPPRPPESVGAKKKHRMLRWERRPEDVEVDLNNYRKTVQRTRQELHKAEAEYNRLETIDAHLRWNFLNNLNLINEEYTLLNDFIANVQQECVKAADLLTSRTRSRGAGKGTYAMKDVLGVLKHKGIETVEGMETGETVPIATAPPVSGIGGLAASVFCDWNRKTAIKRREPASCWTVPGDKVNTPYGVGVVVDVFAPELVSESEPSKPSSGDNNGPRNGEEKKEPERSPIKSLSTYLPPRVSVKLPFGIGYFGLDTVTQVESSCAFSDAKLMERWTKLIETAKAVGSTIDLEGMNHVSKERILNADIDGGTDESSQMDVDENQASTKEPGHGSKDADNDDEDERFMPFGAGLLPTATGRGNLLEKFSINDIERAMEKGLYDGSGVLGKTSHQGVTEDFRKWEDEEQEYLTLEADVLQLRNALVRQKRIRLLNERTDAATADRYNRAADLVAEMRSDLKSLKHRLEEELKELGIDQAATEKILLNFYRGQDSPVDVGESSPLKRSRLSVADMQGAGKVMDDIDEERESTDGHHGDDLSGDDLDIGRTKRLRLNQ